MKLINKIKAFFTFKGEKQEMELSAAEVKSKGVFLHPVDDPAHTFFVKSSSVDIIINQNDEVLEDNITIFDRKNINGLQMEQEIREGFLKELKEESPAEARIVPVTTTYIMPKKRRFSVLLYQDEYDELMSNISSHGYKRTEFFLACVNSVKKQSFETNYKKYTSEHQKRYKAERADAEKQKREATNNIQVS